MVQGEKELGLSLGRERGRGGGREERRGEINNRDWLCYAMRCLLAFVVSEREGEGERTEERREEERREEWKKK